MIPIPVTVDKLLFFENFLVVTSHTAVLRKFTSEDVGRGGKTEQLLFSGTPGLVSQVPCNSHADKVLVFDPSTIGSWQACDSRFVQRNGLYIALLVSFSHR